MLMPCSLWSPMRFYPVVMAPRFDRRRRPDPGSDGALLSETRGGVQRQHIAVGAMARKMCRRGHADIAEMAKGVARLRVGQMDLDQRQPGRPTCVVVRHRLAGIAAPCSQYAPSPRHKQPGQTNATH